MPVSNLSPWQQFLSQRFPGRNAQFTDADLRRAADEFFGPIPIPPGSQIIRQDGGYAEWIDPQGYRHSATRSLDGRDPNAGQVKDNTDRPNVLPAEQGQQQTTTDILGQVRDLASAQGSNAAALARGETPAALDPGIKQFLDQISGLAGELRGQPALASLDPETLAALEQINQAEQGRLQQQFKDAQSTTIAQLYGNRTNQSSIGNDAIARLLQEQGLVSSDQLANSAARRLGLQQFLTQQLQGNRQLALTGLLGAADTQLSGFNASNNVSQNQINSLLDLLKNFTGQQTQRDLAEAGIDQQRRELEESRRGTNLNFELAQQRADQELAATRNSFAKQLIGSLIGSGLSVLSGGLGAGGFLRGGTAGGMPNAGGTR